MAMATSRSLQVVVLGLEELILYLPWPFVIYLSFEEVVQPAFPRNQFARVVGLGMLRWQVAIGYGDGKL